jgi:hypothetical protein
MGQNRRSTSAIARTKLFFRHRARTIFPGELGERVGKFTVESFRDPASRCLTVTSASRIGSPPSGSFFAPGPYRPGNLIHADTSEPSFEKQASRGSEDAGVHLSAELVGGATARRPYRTLRIARPSHFLDCTRPAAG